MRPLGVLSMAVLVFLVAPLQLGNGRAVAAANGTALSRTAAADPELTVHSRTVEVEPTQGERRLFVVGCGPDEQLVGGGYSTDREFLRVVASFPTRGNGRPTLAPNPPLEWTVGVVNTTKAAGTLTVAAACLTGGDGESSVRMQTATHSEFRFSLAVDCPAGSARTGGGYSSDWNPVYGTALVNGSYPIAPGGWEIDAVLASGDPDTSDRVTAYVYALCYSGHVEVGHGLPVSVDLVSTPTDCPTSEGDLTLPCDVPISGSQSVACDRGQVLVGAGYHATSGTLPDYSVLVNAPAPDGRNWNLAIRGSTQQPDSITTIEMVPLCLVVVGAPASPTPSTGPTLDRTTAPPLDPDSRNIASYLGVGVPLLILLLAAAFVLTRARTRRARAEEREHRRGPDARVDVVVRAQRTRYRLNDFRERL